MPAARAAKAEETIKIANIQRVGLFRLQEKRKSPTEVPAFVDIPAGEERDVPIAIWNRYKDREDIKRMDGIQIVVGGLKPGQEMRTPSAQDQYLKAQAKELEEQREELAALKRKLAEREASIEARERDFLNG